MKPSSGVIYIIIFLLDIALFGGIKAGTSMREKEICNALMPAKIRQIRSVDIEDLLEREDICLDEEEMYAFLNQKIVLVTGGGGSIGSQLCRQIAKFSPTLLLIMDISENNAYNIKNELEKNYPSLELKVLTGSVNDKERVEDIFKYYRPQVVFHAAAQKHESLIEDSPFEAIKNNVFGTHKVADAAHTFKTERFVLISTDRAVNPTSVMGATKRICEMIIQAYKTISKTEFAAVRFGNASYSFSNDSIIDLFKKQIEEGGPVTVPHHEMTRCFMTIQEACQLVILAGAYAKGGEIFLLDMGKRIKIDALARDLINLSGFKPDIDILIEYTGLRPGEELHEELSQEIEGSIKTQSDRIFIADTEEQNYDTTMKQIEALVSLMNINRDREALKVLLKEIVISYKG